MMRRTPDRQLVGVRIALDGPAENPQRAGRADPFRKPPERQDEYSTAARITLGRSGATLQLSGSF